MVQAMARANNNTDKICIPVTGVSSLSFPTFLRCFCKLNYPMRQVSPPKISLKLGNFSFQTYKGNIYGIQMLFPEIKVFGL
jgi:hypothetical protein